MKNWWQTLAICAAVLLGSFGIVVALSPRALTANANELKLSIARLDAGIAMSLTSTRFAELAADLEAQRSLHERDLLQPQQTAVAQLVLTSAEVARLWSSISEGVDAATLDKLVSLGALTKDRREKLRTVNFDLRMADLRAGGFDKGMHEAVEGLKKDLISAALTVVSSKGKMALATFDTPK